MAVEPSTLIFSVRAELSDLPEEIVADDEVFRQILNAQTYLGQICNVSALNDGLYGTIVTVLAAYWTYLVYTSLAEQQLGTTPSTTYVKVQALRAKALAFLETVSEVPLKDDLSIDDEKLARTGGLAFNLLPTRIADD